MNEQRFCYWLQGFVELSDTDTVSEKQWLVIKDHLKLVFDKKTPDRTTDFKPTITVGDGVNYERLSDLIGKDYTWPTSPYTVTC